MESTRRNPETEFPLFDLEGMLIDKGYSAICGVDEAGRGPLAGPVVAAAVILPVGITIEGCTDSKALTPERREAIFTQIADLDIPCAVGIIDNSEIDRMNILRASLMAMRKAIMELKQTPDCVLVDGNIHVPRIPQPQFSVIKGDSRCRSIAAASIVAKVTRDRIMTRYEKLYPQFTFSQHKGYSTPEHLKELKEHGPCEIHRMSFKPVAELAESYVLL